MEMPYWLPLNLEVPSEACCMQCQSHLSGLKSSLWVLAVQPGFGRLNVPVRKLSPEEVVQQAPSVTKLVSLMSCGALAYYLHVLRG